jgi:hypothetical protein
MAPSRGYCRQKKMSTAETATPESSAAESTSKTSEYDGQHTKEMKNKKTERR